MEMEDAALVARVLDGEVDAFGELVDRHYPDCARFAYRMLGNRQDVEDVLQDSFLRAYRALGRYRERGTFRSWLFRIVVNRCRTTAVRRRRTSRRFLQDEGALERAAQPSTEEQIIARDALQTSLSTLEPRLREAFLLKYGEGLEYSEMAKLTGASVSALKMRVKRACDLMREHLEGTPDG